VSRAFVLIGLWAASSAGCRTVPEDAATATSAPAPVRAAPQPTDHLADGELLEGDGRAFDLTLPQGFRVEGSFTDAVLASGSAPVHSLVQYLRPRLVGGDLREGEASATFEHVQVAKKPGRTLTIHVLSARRETRLEVHDETAPQRPTLPDDAARWRAVGLTTDGRFLDPTHLD